MARRLVWTTLAHVDKKKIYDYWNKRNHSKAYSRKLDASFKDVTALLLAFPNMGLKSSRKNIRLKIVGDYVLIYRITEAQIQILRVWSSPKNPEDFRLIMRQIDRM